MRVTRVLTVLLASILFYAPAIAQPAPTRTVDDYLCGFAGQCAQERPQIAPNDSVPDLGTPRRFSLGGPSPRSDAAPINSSGKSLSSAQARRPAEPMATNRTASVSHAGRGGVHAKSASAAERRMDLRLSFLRGSAELTNQARSEAEVFAKALLLPQLVDKRFLIEGHTDSTGRRAANLELSRRRAAAVAQYLGSLGVRADRLQVRGYGPDHPLPGLSASAPANRRVEAKLL